MGWQRVENFILLNADITTLPFVEVVAFVVFTIIISQPYVHFVVKYKSYAASYCLWKFHIAGCRPLAAIPFVEVVFLQFHISPPITIPTIIISQPYVHFVVKYKSYAANIYYLWKFHGSNLFP